MSITGPGSTSVVGGGPAPAALSCSAFTKEPLLRQVLSGATPAIVRGAPTSSAVKTVQTALFSLGCLPRRNGLDGQFGPGTEAAIKTFQTAKHLTASGQLDTPTLKALDAAASAQITTLKGRMKPRGSKAQAFTLEADISNPAKTRLYVLDKSNKVVARFLTSPGTAEHPTVGSSFTIKNVIPRGTWHPPNSAWAANAQPVGPGVDNPMGILKLQLGDTAEYIHGIPASEEPALGKAASHGCLRTSGSNVLKIFEDYAEAGTRVTINRNPVESARLQAGFDAASLADIPTDAGREYLFGYCSGELGQAQKLNG